MRKLTAIILLLLALGEVIAQNRDPLKAELVTADIDRFWIAFDAAKPDFKPEAFQREYLDKGSDGVKGFTKERIQNAEYFAKVVARHARYYASIQPSTLRISGMEAPIRQSLVKLKDLYPKAVFPPVYFVIGALNSGGTSTNKALIIGAEMYGLTRETPIEELNDWLRDVLKPVDELPHIVAHELIHFQQRYTGPSLLSACLREGSADFIAELISGKHINQHVHDFANPVERKLWEEFKIRMNEKDFTGWLYSPSPGRPNDLGYWMGYKIAKAYYDKMPDKAKAVADIISLKDAKKFLEASGYNGGVH